MAARSRPKSGAGTLVWVRRYDLVEFAVVLEPDEPLASARRAFFAGMNARGRRDMRRIARRSGRSVSTGPTRSGSTAGLLGGARLGWPDDCAEDEVPAWLVFGVILRAADMAHIEEVQAASGVAHAERRFRDDRHRRDHRKFCAPSDDRVRPLERTRVRGDRTGLSGAACRRARPARSGRIDVNGDLLVRAAAGKGPPERTSLVDALARAAWYDPPGARSETRMRRTC